MNELYCILNYYLA